MFRKFLFVIFSAFFLVGCDSSAPSTKPLKILISPYQDLGMYVNAEPLKLEEKYGTDVEFVTIPWGDTYSAMLSAAPVGDLAFASFPDFLIRAENLNKNSSDPLLFIYPAYVFRGGAFITYNDNVPTLDKGSIKNKAVVADFFNFKIGFPHNTMYQYMMAYLAQQNGIVLDHEKLIDVDFDTAYLGTRNGDLDIGSVGLTQLTEARKDGGRVVLNMDTLGFSDLMGFIVKKSTLEHRRKDILNAINMWFESVSHVTGNLDENSAYTLAYLKDKAATQYSLDSFKAALSQELFFSGPDDIYASIVTKEGTYSFEKIAEAINAYKGPPYGNMSYVKIHSIGEELQGD